MPTPDNFVRWLRGASPYIHAHRGRTFVVTLGGEAVADPGFAELVHDIALLHGLGIRLVLVPGARPQIAERLQQRGAELLYISGLRVTDDPALACVKEAAGAVRVEIEALLSMGLTNSPMAGARIRVASGNFVTARPLGVRDGIDYGHTGVVRRIDAEAIRQRLDDGAIALVPPIGYSPTGEVFNLSAQDVAASTAIALGADKLICLVEDNGVADREGRLVSNLEPRQVDRLLEERAGELSEELVLHLEAAVEAARSGVKRVHLVSRRLNGALLRELFTRDGVGTLLTATPYEDIRTARIDDVGGVLELIEPLEKQGALVRRSREALENEIERFTVMERDGMIVGCAALYPYPADAMAELGCLAVHPDYRRSGRGDKLLELVMTQARGQKIGSLFVLTTQTAHWFLERGFEQADIESLPMERQALYNYRRNSKVFVKRLDWPVPSAERV
jgi:amino-acid N-acetyltransferase